MEKLSIEMRYIFSNRILDEVRWFLFDLCKNSYQRKPSLLPVEKIID